jgi:hypothetical protein
VLPLRPEQVLAVIVVMIKQVRLVLQLLQW